MTDTDIQSHSENAGNETADGVRSAADTGANATRDAANTTLDAEQRSFASATETGHDTLRIAGEAAQGSLKAGREMASAGQDAIRRAGDQAAEAWRASLGPISQFQSELGRWVDHLWRQTASTRLQTASPFAGMFLAPFTGQPLADMRETDDGLELSVELPGLKAENVQLALQGNVLRISGEKSDLVEEDRGVYRVSERRFGQFERSFVLPPEADHGRIEASFVDGLLKVTIGKTAQAAEPKTIPIKG